MDTLDDKFFGDKSGGIAETVRTFDAFRMQHPSFLLKIHILQQP